MKNFKFTGLEIHNRRMWNWAAVERALDFINEFGMDALIFHQNDLLDAVVLPQKYFDEEEMWAYWPIRYCAVGTNGQYIKKLLRECTKRGIQFYFEVKEIWYPAALLEKFPHLRGTDGHICPSEPFWFEFLSNKVQELTEIFPQMAGMIVSPATRESKVSIAAGQCGCSRCRSLTDKEWYSRYIQAVYEPLEKAGKRLIVRDFAYDSHSQSSVMDAAADRSSDIVMALKNVPHDFWPTFPDNPAIESKTTLEKWVEYDVWGQYCGLGVFPCSLVEDIIRRQTHCLECGCSGIWYRTDWELLDDCSCFSSLNMLNLIAGVMHAKNPDCTVKEIYQRWIQYGINSAFIEESAVSPPQIPSKDSLSSLRHLMETGNTILMKSLFVRGHVFSYSSRYQHAYESIYRVMNVYHRRDQWDPSSKQKILPTKENLEIIFQEKQEALNLARRLEETFDAEALGVSDEQKAYTKEMLHLLVLYVRGFQLSAQVYFHMNRAVEMQDERSIGEALKDCEELEEFCIELEDTLRSKHYPFYICWMMDPEELKLLAADIRRLAGGSSGTIGQVNAGGKQG